MIKLEKMLNANGIKPTKKDTKPSVLVEDAHKIAQEQTRRQNAIEDKLAKKYYGVSSWEELDEDEKEEITFLALDILRK